jgi:WD40 repeat protein
MQHTRSISRETIERQERALILNRLSKSRRKRPIPKDWATSEIVEKFGVASASEPLYSGSSCLAVDEAGQLVIVGGSDGMVGVYSISENQVQQSFQAESSITDAVWYGNYPVVSTSSGAVKIYGSTETTFTSHAGSANGLALHPSGDILASVGIDKSFVFYDLPAGRIVTQVYTDSSMPSPMIKSGAATLDMLTKIQNSLLLRFILMGSFLQQEVRMGKSNFFMSRLENTRQHSKWKEQSKTLASRRTESGLQLLQRAPVA